MDETPQIKFLRRLVTTLMVVMIAGLVCLIGLIVIRFGHTTPSLPLPASIALAGSGTAIAVTQGLDWYGVVVLDGDSQRFEVYNLDGTLRQSIDIEASPQTTR